MKRSTLRYVRRATLDVGECVSELSFVPVCLFARGTGAVCEPRADYVPE